MPRCLLARIAIGGPLPADLVEDLLEAIQEEGIEHDGDGYPIQLESADYLLELAGPEGGASPLRLMHREASWGQFETLEEFLLDNAIPFDRWTEGWSDSDPELVVFRPGMDQPVSRCTNQEGHLIIETRRLQPVLVALREGQVETATSLLTDALGPAITDLPPFTIQD